jgi:hypothetical protein
MATTDIFRSIMIGHDEVNVTKAISVGMETTGMQRAISNWQMHDNDRHSLHSIPPLALLLPLYLPFSFASIYLPYRLLIVALVCYLIQSSFCPSILLFNVLLSLISFLRFLSFSFWVQGL